MTGVESVFPAETATGREVWGGGNVKRKEPPNAEISAMPPLAFDTALSRLYHGSIAPLLRSRG